MAATDRLDQFDLTREVLRVLGRDTGQLRQILRSDTDRCGMMHAMHHPMSNRAERRTVRFLLEPSDQEFGRRAMIGRL